MDYIIDNTNISNKEKDNYNNMDLNNKTDEFNWYIKIDTINLYAPIEETVDIRVLEKSVGHFNETATTNGNVGLAGHNSGYNKNYFENLNKLKIGDEIIYKYNDFKKEYIVKMIKIIKNTDWSYLESSKENKITLITCINNKPESRLCIQAISK